MDAAEAKLYGSQSPQGIGRSDPVEQLGGITTKAAPNYDESVEITP